MTNRDKIQQMSDEELAERIVSGFTFCDEMPCLRINDVGTCTECCKAWLNKEAEA